MKRTWKRPFVAALLLIATAMIATGTMKTLYSYESFRVDIPTKEAKILTGKLFIPSSAPEEKSPGILLSHGANNEYSAMEAYAAKLASSGCTVLLFNQYNHGQSSIAETPSMGTSDALKYLYDLDFVDKECIGAIGHTMGGYYLSIAAEETGIPLSAVLNIDYIDISGSLMRLYNHTDNLGFILARYDEHQRSGSLEDTKNRLSALYGKEERTENGIVYTDGVHTAYLDTENINTSLLPAFPGALDTAVAFFNRTLGYEVQPSLGLNTVFQLKSILQIILFTALTVLLIPVLFPEERMKEEKSGENKGILITSLASVAIYAVLPPLYMIGKIMLQVRRNGHGKDGKPVVFPKLVFLYDDNQVKADPFSSELFNEAVKTSAECMYPDYLSLSSRYGSVSQIFQKYGAITSPMGCRAFLSLWCNEKGEAITIGRCNIGAVSLNLPIILKLAQIEHPDDWKEKFWEMLDDRLEVIRAFFKKRYDIVRHQKCSSNPLAFTQGGLYEGTKSPDDTVGDLVRYMTASFGITALDETTYLWTGKRLVDEGGKVSASILRHLQEKLAEFKKEDGYLYAIYGTPAESLCATQAGQYDRFCEKMGVENVFASTPHYSPEYFTNSFHVNVTEEISPFEKQDHEFEDFHLCEGGHIQYVRLDNPENMQAVRAMIRRGMEKGFYQGVNFDSAYCGDCGEHSTNVLFKCPHCGSSNLSVISRVCGYLGYSNVNGMSRMNDGKMAEIKNRVSM